DAIAVNLYFGYQRTPSEGQRLGNHLRANRSAARQGEGVPEIGRPGAVGASGRSATGSATLALVKEHNSPRAAVALLPAFLKSAGQDGPLLYRGPCAAVSRGRQAAKRASAGM